MENFTFYAVVLANEILEPKSRISSTLMNNIFHFAEKRYYLRNSFTLEKNGILLFITAQRIFFTLLPNNGGS